MARAKAQGKHVGRPSIPQSIQDEIEHLRREDPPVSIRQISKRLGIGYKTAWSYVKALEE